MSEARLLFALPALREKVSAEVLDHLQRRLPAPREPQTPAAGADAGITSPGTGAKRLTTGFSDGELARLLAALRSDAAKIRDRIRAGEDLLRRYQAGPLALARRTGTGDRCWRAWPPPGRFPRRPEPARIRSPRIARSWRDGCS